MSAAHAVGSRPLEGLLVLDFSTLLPGPMATLLLAEAGAEVIKIERPGRGEEMRSYTPKWGADSINFALLNRGKKSVALDLKNGADRARLDPLIERADVLVEQFRPGVMERLGLGYKTVAQKNPRVIYCSITGYGQTGPKRDKVGHDLNYIADTGLLALSMGSVDQPVVPPALIADIAGGAYPAFMNIALALYERYATGRGRYLDIAMTDNLFPFMYWAIGNGLAAGAWPGNGTELVTGGTARYRLYPTADGKVVAAAPIEAKFWAEFCETIDLEPELRDDRINPQGTVRRVSEIIRSQPSSVWRTRFASRECCCSIVATAREALEDEHFRARGLFNHSIVNEAGARLYALPVPIDPAFRTPGSDPGCAPHLGHHNTEYIA
jgi:crotonobetainyl-CoA:carnitine CoA-transferase CaiB-like acyl-CoA transferase